MSRVSVQSYLLVDDKPYLISDYRGAIPDEFYIEGWIELMIDDQVVMDRRHTDLVDQLWVYILDGATEIKNGSQHWECYFPDQPLKIAMTTKPTREMLFSLGASQWPVNQTKFIQALAQEATRFFEAMQRLIPQDAAAWSRFKQQAEQL